MTRRMILAVALVVGLAAPAWAGFDEGLAAYFRGDYGTALREWKPLAEEGDINAQLMLGFMYDEGAGVPRDAAEAVKWYRKAAEQGYADAQYILGFMYTMGWSGAQDYVQAHMWLTLAAAQRDEAARKFRDRVAKRMTPEQIAEAQRLAREWRPKAPPKPDMSLQVVQSYLKDLGYDPGPDDGVMGERTRRAIAGFKADMASAGTLSVYDGAILELIEGLPK